MPWAAIATILLLVSGCTLHVTKSGVSGNILGHSFSGASGSLPTGFPSNVPVPDNSRVLAGGGAGNAWDVAFAVKGEVSSSTAAYESKLRSSGYTVSNVESGSTPLTAPTGTNSGQTSTTVTMTGTVFEATDSTWTLHVAAGTTTASTSGLKSGEFALSVTVLPTKSS